MNVLVRTVLRTVTVAVDCCLAWRTMGSTMADISDRSKATSSTPRAGISTTSKASNTEMRIDDGRTKAMMISAAVSDGDDDTGHPSPSSIYTTLE